MSCQLFQKTNVDSCENLHSCYVMPENALNLKLFKKRQICLIIYEADDIRDIDDIQDIIFESCM